RHPEHVAATRRSWSSWSGCSWTTARSTPAGRCGGSIPTGRRRPSFRSRSRGRSGGGSPAWGTTSAICWRRGRRSATWSGWRLETERPAVQPGPLEIEWGEGEDVRRRVSDLVASLAERDYVLPLDVNDSSIPGESEVVFKHNLERELIVRSTQISRRTRYYLS